MPRIGDFEVRTREELSGSPRPWCSVGEEGPYVLLGVIRWVCRQPVCGELVGPAHLLVSPPQVRRFLVPQRVEPEDLAGVLTRLLAAGYRVTCDPVKVPVSMLELLMLRGEIAPDPEPAEGA